MNYKIVIPARGGSKRFKKKNLALLNGKPLISHTIEYALRYFSKDNIWVNTDNDEIAEVSKFYDIQLTKRPDRLATDTTSTAEVLSFQCELFEKLNINFDAVILLQVTNPIRPDELLNNCIELFEKKNRESLASFTKLNKKYGKIENSIFYPQNYAPGQRMQDLIPEYFENGLIYITKKKHLQKGIILTEDVFPYIYNGIEAMVDIDEPIDIVFAEFCLEKLKI